MVRLIEYRQLTSILAMFLIVQLAGLLIVFYLLAPAEVTIGTTAGGVSGSGGVSVLFYFVYLIAAAVVMYFLFKKYHGPRLFVAIEAIVVASAAFYLFLIVLTALFPDGANYNIAVALVSGVALVAAKNKWPGLRNFTAVIASVGVGLVLGIFFGSPPAGFIYALTFMALVAVYDYVAVFITKHMITLGRESVNRNLAFMVGSYDVEVLPKGYLKAKEASRLSKEFGVVKSGQLKRLMKSGNVPMPSFSALGAGDLAIPLMVAVSAYVSYLSYFFSALLVACSCLGLVFAMYVSKKYRMALPAIPPLFAFASIGLGIYVMLTTPSDWHLYSLAFIEGIVVLVIMWITAVNQYRKGAGQALMQKRTTSSRS